MYIHVIFITFIRLQPQIPILGIMSYWESGLKDVILSWEHFMQIVNSAHSQLTLERNVHEDHKIKGKYIHH